MVKANEETGKRICEWSDTGHLQSVMVEIPASSDHGAMPASRSRAGVALALWTKSAVPVISGCEDLLFIFGHPKAA